MHIKYSPWKFWINFNLPSPFPKIFGRFSALILAVVFACSLVTGGSFFADTVSCSFRKRARFMMRINSNLRNMVQNQFRFWIRAAVRELKLNIDTTQSPPLSLTSSSMPSGAEY